MKKIELLKKGNYLTVIKPLAHLIGLEETILLMELVGMEEYKERKQKEYEELCEEEGWKPDPKKIQFYKEDNSFRCSVAELEFNTTMKDKKQNRVLNNLEKKWNVITVLQKGLPAKRFIKINHNEIEKLFDNAIRSHKEFKDRFYKEKEEYIKKKMEKRKLNVEENTLFRQNDGTDNNKVSDVENTSKPHDDQFRQNDGTSSSQSAEQVPPNRRSYNNSSSSKNNSFKNITFEEEEEGSKLYKLLKKINDNICPVNEVIKKSLENWLHILPYEVVNAELDNCIVYGAKTWAYIESAFEEDHKQEIKTVEQLKEKIEKHKVKKKNFIKNNDRNIIRKEKEPEWFKERKHHEDKTPEYTEEEFLIEKAKLEKRLEKYKHKPIRQEPIPEKPENI